MGRGIVGTVTLAATLAFAIPVGLLGIEFLLDGRTLPGGGFLVLAVLMVAVEEYLTTPGDVPGEAAERVVGTVVRDPDEEGDE